MSIASIVQELKGKNVLISGAASGIGKGIAELFSNHGAGVGLFDLNEEMGSKVSDEINAKGGNSLFIKGDVASDDDCSNVVESILNIWGRLDILVNNAGIIRRETILETSEKDWDRGMAVNVKSVYLLSRKVIPAMLEMGRGTIINIASGWGLVGGKKAALYCASKGAVIQLTRAMALDHGPEGIRVNCICPGDTRTPMLDSEAQQLGLDWNHFLKQAEERPIGRVGTPLDIAEAALFFASDKSSFITGTTLVVDGGGLAG